MRELTVVLLTPDLAFVLGINQFGSNRDAVAPLN
jgi:hypothetical protein